MDLYGRHGQHTNIVVAFRSILNLCVLASFDFLRYGDNFVVREHKAHNASIGQKSHGTEEDHCCSYFTAGTLDLSHEKVCPGHCLIIAAKTWTIGLFIK